MATVWVATQSPLERQVAVKIVHPHLACRVLADRLRREARALGRLSHPAIVRVFDFGETDKGGPYIVMELLAGEELRTKLERERKLVPEAAIQLLLPIASGLCATHAVGVVHRDLKPENVFLAQGHEGGLQPKIVDFGIAMLARSGDSRTTLGAGPIGTPAYMPPEQERCIDVDHRADVWSFSALLYETIAGCTPCEAQQADGSRSLGDVADVDPMLSAIVDRGLEGDPCRRWQSMRDLGAALASWLVSRGVTEDVCGMSLSAAWRLTDENQSRPRRPERAGSRRVTAAAIALSVMATATAVASRCLPPPPEVAHLRHVSETVWPGHASPVATVEATAANSAAPGVGVASDPAPPAPRSAPATRTPAPRPARRLVSRPRASRPTSEDVYDVTPAQAHDPY